MNILLLSQWAKKYQNSTKNVYSPINRANNVVFPLPLKNKNQFFSYDIYIYIYLKV